MNSLNRQLYGLLNLSAIGSLKHQLSTQPSTPSSVTYKLLKSLAIFYIPEIVSYRLSKSSAIYPLKSLAIDSLNR